MRIAVIRAAKTATPGGVQRFGAELTRSLIECGADVVEFRLHPGPHQSRVGALSSGVAGMVKAHADARFDAVLSTFHWPPKLLPVPTFGFIHDLQQCSPSRWSPQRVAWSMIAKSWRRVFAPTDHVAHSLAKTLGVSGVVTGEGLDHLDPLWLRPAPQRSTIGVLVGRTPNKRPKLALAAAGIIATDLGLPVVALGPVTRGLPAGFTVMDQPDDSKLAHAYQSMKVLLAPSRYEGFGLAVGEALRAGTPVVYARDGTLAGLVGAAGLGADPTPEALAEAMRSVLSGDEAALARQARAQVREYSWAATAARILGVIETAARRP